MDSNTAVMSRDYGNSNMSDIPLSSSVECITEGTRIDGTVKLKPKKNDSLPRFFRRKKSDPSEFCMSTKEELKPTSSRTNSLGRRLQFRISQMRNPPGTPVETLKHRDTVETKKGNLRSTLSGYWSSMFKKTPRESDEIVPSIKIESPTIVGVLTESLQTVETLEARIPDVPKLVTDESADLEKVVKSTTQEVYVG